jgi:hypothetical protein
LTPCTDTTSQSHDHGDRIAGWLLIAIGIYSFGLVSLLNVHILSSGSTQERAIILMADGLILFWIVIGGALTPVLRKRLVPRLAAIPRDWRLRFVVLCTTMALVEEVITTSMTNLAPLLGTTPEEAHITDSTNYFVVVCYSSPCPCSFGSGGRSVTTVPMPSGSARWWLGSARLPALSWNRPMNEPDGRRSMLPPTT